MVYEKLKKNFENHRFHHISRQKRKRQRILTIRSRVRLLASVAV